uniref:Uncharacterized protein n=1 Tax=Mycena chlorophos TaxID=658473 RepID=A0ABQ0L1J1_MYCCL|nr:predicted protein [Mycena chlorophos]
MEQSGDSELWVPLLVRERVAYTQFRLHGFGHGRLVTSHDERHKARLASSSHSLNSAHTVLGPTSKVGAALLPWPTEAKLEPARSLFHNWQSPITLRCVICSAVLPEDSQSCRDDRNFDDLCAEQNNPTPRLTGPGEDSSTGNRSCALNSWPEATPLVALASRSNASAEPRLFVSFAGIFELSSEDLFCLPFRGRKRGRRICANTIDTRKRGDCSLFSTSASASDSRPSSTRPDQTMYRSPNGKDRGGKRPPTQGGAPQAAHAHAQNMGMGMGFYPQYGGQFASFPPAPPDYGPGGYGHHSQPHWPQPYNQGHYGRMPMAGFGHYADRDDEESLADSLSGGPRKMMNVKVTLAANQHVQVRLNSGAWVAGLILAVLDVAEKKCGIQYRIQYEVQGRGTVTRDFDADSRDFRALF